MIYFLCCFSSKAGSSYINSLSVIVQPLHYLSIYLCVCVYSLMCTYMYMYIQYILHSSYNITYVAIQKRNLLLFRGADSVQSVSTLCDVPLTTRCSVSIQYT